MAEPDSLPCCLVWTGRNKAPCFVTALQDVSVEVGRRVVLSCQVGGTPSPSVFWRRNGLMVADTPDFLQSLSRGLARMELLAAREKHAGHYECVANNDAGDAACSCHLTVTLPKGLLGEGGGGGGRERQCF